MKSKQIRSSILLAITAIIWGVAFVAQTTGGDAVGPFSFNCVRFIIGSAVLLPVIFILDKLGFSKRKPVTKKDYKKLWLGGFFVGLALFFAANAQQVGISLGAQVSKAGFLTALYIILVPILGIFIKKKCGWNIWLGVAISVVGMYFLCIDGRFRLQWMDIALIASAFLFAVQILLIDYFSPQVDPVRLSSIEFLVCGVLSGIPAAIFDIPARGGLSLWIMDFATWNAWIPILYAGVFSSGVAYTLQVVAQPGLNPTVASLIMSFEAVFGTLAGWILLGQTLTAREIIGCVLMFIAIIIAQQQFTRLK
ncbi:MAG: DMT family transporter [Lachnospiraceae bacterium]|nr:DMT family transporter [Lachnospiraceae bacterium]